MSKPTHPEEALGILGAEDQAYADALDRNLTEKKSEPNTLYAYRNDKGEIRIQLGGREVVILDVPVLSKTTGLTFSEALEAMKAGKKIRRPDWPVCRAWIEDGRILLTEDYDWDLNDLELLAEDWEIVEGGDG